MSEKKSFDTIILGKPGTPLWEWSGRRALAITAHGAFVLEQLPFYRYARCATVEDFRAAFGDTGAELVCEERSGRVELSVKRIPWSLIARARDFFVEVWRRYESEDILLLDYYFTQQTYALTHPKLQYADKMGVGYEMTPAPPGAVRFGTLHSHPPHASGIHSSMDDRDVRGTPGFHFVVGALLSSAQTLGCVLSTGDVIITVDPCALLETPCGNDFPSQWLTREGLPIFRELHPIYPSVASNLPTKEE